MRTNYATLLALTFASFHVNAQLTLTKAANEPVLGDVVTMADYDSTTSVPKNTGAGQTWNFSSLSNSSSFTETTTYTTVASTPAASLFPAATLAARRGSNYEYFKSGSNTWEYLGQYDTQDQVNLSNSGIFASWPISFGSSNSDVASGVQSSTSGSAAVNATLSYVASGSGTVILPGGNMHTNCLQIVESLTVIIGAGSSSMTINNKTYRYYSSSRKFPIVEIQYDTQVSSSGTDKSFDALVDNGATIVGMHAEKTPIGSMSLFPVPSLGELNFVLADESMPESIEVYDARGALVMKATQSRSIDVSVLPDGLYVARVRSGAIVHQKVFAVARM
jgi:hypothetical protein